MTTAPFPYRLGVERVFEARHYLTVPNPGPEGEIHNHRFRLELEFAGSSLNDFGYLVDIDRVKEILEEIETRYGETLLNDHPEFEDRNPSVERFATIVGDHVGSELAAPDVTPHVSRLTVRLWEDDDAWASYTRDLRP